MTNTKSIQTTFTDKTTKGEIALFIECRKCGKGRVYFIDENLWSLQNKEASAISIEVECEKCKNIIYIGIGYTEKQKGFSYTKPDFFGKNGFQVCDNNGLQDMQSKIKAI